jgi:hypothetical protein
LAEELMQTALQAKEQRENAAKVASKPEEAPKN